jgi:hypothetical protein
MRLMRNQRSEQLGLPLLWRFLGRLHHKTAHALLRQASEKRQGTKSRVGRDSVSPRRDACHSRGGAGHRARAHGQREQSLDERAAHRRRPRRRMEQALFAFRPAPSGSINTGRRSTAWTMFMETATSFAPARRWKPISRRRNRVIARGTRPRRRCDRIVVVLPYV